MHHVGIIGTGSYVPERVLTNHDLEKMVETSDKWIFERTGIRERRIAAEEETNVTMGRIALKRAIENARIDPTEIEMLVVGTNTTEPMWPSAGGVYRFQLFSGHGRAICKIRAIQNSRRGRIGQAFSHHQL